ncbi:hypothetical protein JHK87_006286 [Glycine soja]|nr:hypothetical protein JHK87_006286 [Glycine soja]
MNAKRREDMVDVLPKRRILMRHEKSQGNRNTTAYTTILDYNIQSTTQGMTQALCIGEHLHRMIGSDGFSPDLRVQFYMSPYACTRSTLPKLKLSKKRIIGMREESRVREWDFGNFQVEERMKDHGEAPPEPRSDWLRKFTFLVQKIEHLLEGSKQILGFELLHVLQRKIEEAAMATKRLKKLLEARKSSSRDTSGLEEVFSTTNGFSVTSLLRHGTYGSVYYSLLHDQVELIGYAASHEELFLVYEYA